MDQATEDRVQIIVAEQVKGMNLVGREFCIERHKGVKTLEEKVKSVDNRLWGLVVLALVQLAALVGILIKG